MEWSDLLNIIKDGEGPRLDFKESPFIGHPEDVSIDLVSFANRYGGKILVGVKDDGSIEHATIDKDKESLAILNVAHDKCSPVIEIGFDYASSADGDVLLINIPKRKEMPHAIIDRSGFEIVKRKYYIRSGNRNRLVDDNLLQYMFQHLDDPSLSIITSLCVWYNRKPFNLSPFRSPSYISSIEPFLPEFNHQNTDYLFSDESDNIQSLMIEILPYAFLEELSWPFSLSWLIKIENANETRTIRPQRVDIPYESIGINTIPFHGLDILPKLSIDTKDILGKFMREFKLPEGTKIKIEIKSKSKDVIRESILTLENPFFNVRIIFRSDMWRAGLPGVIRTIILPVEDQLKIQNDFAYCVFTMKFEAQFGFLDFDDPLFKEHFMFAQVIYNLIQDKWNWDNETKKLKDSTMDRINRNVMRILSLMEGDTDLHK
jgi:Schlafen, AlbA_2